jgi:hypothetical protein
MERIGREVERTLSQTGGDRALRLSRITAAWPEAVGEAVSRQAWPLRLGRDGTLHVATSSATWAFELDRLAPEIGAQLASALGESPPRRFRFRVGPIPEPGSLREAPGEGPSTPAEVPPEATAAAVSAAAAIEDPELRELVARAASASLARARSGRAF